MEEVADQAGGDVLGRPHIAAILVRKGYVNSTKHAFDTYLAPGGLAYYDKERLTAAAAIGMVRQCGGVPVLAHPVQLRTENDAQLDRVIKDLADAGLGGLEVIHSDHSPALIEKYSALAERLGLLKTGGSDFHGKTVKNIDLGFAAGRRVPREYYEKLVQRVGKL
jgi:hypothetical protein